jgi:secondary thiamine-phosphate synthase enzyme
MSWSQKKIALKSRSRGVYLITDEVLTALPEIKEYKVGVLHLFIQHTSAALSLNENWDSDVRADMNDAFNSLIPDDHEGRFRHTGAGEGPDDMAGHIKATLVGASLSIPITNGKLATGTWQGIYLLEFRDYRHQRNIVATINGQR